MEDENANTQNQQKTSTKDKHKNQTRSIKYTEGEILYQIQNNPELQIIQKLKTKLEISRQSRYKTNIEINNTKNEYIAMKGSVKQFIADQNQNNHKVSYPKRNNKE